MSEQGNLVASQKKRVLQLCHGYGMPFHDVARQYAALFKDTDYKVTTVFLTGKQDAEIAHSIESDEVIFLENTSKDIRGLKRKQIKQVREICLKNNFQFCIAHRFKPIYIAAHIPRLKVIGVHHAFGDYQRWTRKLFVKRRKENICFLGVSNAIRDDIRKSLREFPNEQIQTLYNRINIDKQQVMLLGREEARRRLHLPEDAYIYANVGRLHPDKDQSTLLKAFALVQKQLPDTLLVIMGKGRLEQQLKEEANKLGISQKVIFTGAIPNASNYFKAFDCFALSSDHEPFGMVLLEAMVAGLPLVVCNTGGAPEVCGDTGLTFNLKDRTTLAKQMIELAKIPAKNMDNKRSQMTCRVKTFFTDEAVKKQFWETSFIKELT